MVSMRIRKAATSKELEALVDDLITTGYVVKEQGTSSTLLKKKTWGSGAGWIVSIIVALILTVFTFGLSWILPIAYGVYAHYSAEEVLIRIEAEA